jgi:hypothetical protein
MVLGQAPGTATAVSKFLKGVNYFRRDKAPPPRIGKRSRAFLGEKEPASIA